MINNWIWNYGKFKANKKAYIEVKNKKTKIISSGDRKNRHVKTWFSILKLKKFKFLIKSQNSCTSSYWGAMSILRYSENPETKVRESGDIFFITIIRCVLKQCSFSIPVTHKFQTVTMFEKSCPWQLFFPVTSRCKSNPWLPW